jgi:hypothetical protein
VSVFISIFWDCTKSCNKSQEDLDKSGYKTNTEGKKSSNPHTCILEYPSYSKEDGSYIYLT